MKEDILIVIKDFYPITNAITNCMETYISKLKENYNIIILTCNQKNNINFEIYNSIKIYRSKDRFDEYNKNKNLYSELKWKLYYHSIKKIYDVFWNVNDAVKIGKKIIKENNVTKIISVSYPFLAHIIAGKLTNNNCKWYAIQYDPYTFNYTYINKYINSRMKNEIKTLKKCEKIFLPLENYNQNVASKLSFLSSKYKVIDYPLIINNCKNNNTNKDYYVFAYTGMLYSDIRNPKDTLDFFYNLLQKKDFKFRLYLYYIGNNTVDDIIEPYKSKFGKSLIIKKNVAKNDCDKILEYSNFIINISNSIENQTPSKIFEYISLGKPIINFYSINNDICKKILENYSIKFNINNTNITNDFIDFCIKNKNNYIDFEEIKNNYKISEEVVEDFISELN